MIFKEFKWMFPALDMNMFKYKDIFEIFCYVDDNKHSTINNTYLLNYMMSVDEEKNFNLMYRHNSNKIYKEIENHDEYTLNPYFIRKDVRDLIMGDVKNTLTKIIRKYINFRRKQREIIFTTINIGDILELNENGNKHFFRIITRFHHGVIVGELLKVEIHRLFYGSYCKCYKDKIVNTFYLSSRDLKKKEYRKVDVYTEFYVE
jgi:hypothetical protein